MNDTTAPRRPAPAPAPIDTWAVLDFWIRRWWWLAAWTIILAIVGGVAARVVWKPFYSTASQMIRFAPSTIDDAYHPRDIATPSLVKLLQSPRFMEEVGEKMTPAMSGSAVDAAIDIILDRNGEVVTIAGTGSTREEAVAIVNQFTEAAVAYTKELQREEAVTALRTVQNSLDAVEKDIASTLKDATPEAVASAASTAAAPEPEPSFTAVSDLAARAAAARSSYDELRAQFYDSYPGVARQKAIVDQLEEQLRKQTASNPAALRNRSSPLASPINLSMRVSPEDVATGENIRFASNNRATFAARATAIQPYTQNPPGYFSIFEPASLSRTWEHKNLLEVVLWTVLGAFIGFIGSAGQILLQEFLDNRVKTRADVRRVTGLPLLATLGDLTKLNATARDQWAFRAWTALQSRLSLSPNHGMICGITSARAGDGRSTWVELLSRAASNCGFRVLTITAQPSEEMTAELDRQNKISPWRKHRVRGKQIAAGANGGRHLATTAGTAGTGDDGVSLTTNVLSSPGKIVERLAAADSPPVVNIPLPGWVWNLERRKQWQSALEAWRAIENIVIFVELPPASVPETVLLAENIPNLLWLADSRSSDAAETHVELETLRDARCNLVGAVLNREPHTPVRGRFSRWLGSSGFIVAAGLLALQPTDAQAATAAAAPAPAFTATAPAARAAWQQKLTLGPGDVLTFHLFGSPELTREEVPVGPDGRISYLEAESIVAAGLTVDELRDKLNEELGRFRRAPQAYVSPVSYNSKKYYVLGAVNQRGAYPLDRPITVIEAVARARGFETSFSQGRMAESADFSGAFITRRGQRLPVDFEKLFLHGDLTQNVALEPDDYLYFPTGSGGSIYLLGEVAQPGVVAHSGNTSILSAIAERGGFSNRAWKKKILVVRGSLNQPETFVVDVGQMLLGTAPNFALRPGDLVFVNHRPWIKVEELLNLATSAFLEAATATWTGRHIGPGVSTTPVITR